MSQVLATYPSKSNPGKQYEIIQPINSKKVPYCTCWQWKLNRTCSHLEDYLSNVSGLARPAIKQGLKASKRQYPKYADENRSIEDIINEEVTRLRNQQA